MATARYDGSPRNLMTSGSVPSESALCACLHVMAVIGRNDNEKAMSEPVGLELAGRLAADS
jgi:hypothetical protein